MSSRKWWMLALVAALLAVGVTRGQASQRPAPQLQGGVVQVGEDWILPPGEVVQGDVLVISADATVRRNARLEGNLTVLSGDATIEGTVRGDVNVVEGKVYLRSGSLVTGDVNVAFGDVVREPGARVGGQVNRSQVEWERLRGAWPSWLLPLVAGQPPEPGTAAWFAVALLRAIFGVVQSLVISFAVAAVAAVLTLLWPEEVTRVARTIEDAWLPALGVGVLTWIVGGLVVLLLMVTICFAILGVAGLAMLLGVVLLGWTAVGKMVGERLWAALGLDVSAAFWPTVAGTFLITLLSRAPCVGWVFGFFVGSVALGGAVLSLYARFAARRSLANP